MSTTFFCRGEFSETSVPISITFAINMGEYLRQAEDYQKHIKDSDKSKFLQNWMIKDLSHPFPAVRAAEILKWFKGAQRRILGTTTDVLTTSLNW